MGRLRALPLMISLLFLAGCAGRGGGTGEELAQSIQAEYSQFTAVTCRVDLRAEYDERVFDCTLDVAWDNATGATLTIVEPELAKGVTARIANGEASLQYGDFSLETGPLTWEGLSPMETVPALWGQITGGYIAGTSLTEGLLEVTYRPGDDPPGTGLEAVVTFDTESGKPTVGELFWDGSRVVTVEVQAFEMMGATEHGTDTNEDVGGD